MCESLSFKSTLPCLPTCLSRVSIDLVTVINDVCGVYDTVPVPTASDILSLKPDSWLVSELGRISDANKRRLDAYVQRLGGDTEHFAFDLSQNADKRCRAAHPTHMSTLTKNCGLWYVSTLKRFICSWVALHEHCLAFGSDTVTQRHMRIAACCSACSRGRLAGGGELLLAHGFPVAKWAAERLQSAD